LARRRGSRRADGDHGGGGSQVTRRVERAEQNLIWELAHDIWRPVKHPKFKEVEAAAKARRQPSPPDPRSGHPVHRSAAPRLTRQRQDELAAELGYRPTPDRGPGGATIYHRPDGDPRYISYDHAGHGAGVRDADGRRTSYDGTPDTAPNVSWKGSDQAGRLRTTSADDRDGTYVPTYNDRGGIDVRRVKR